MPALSEQFTRDSIEVRFVYPDNTTDATTAEAAMYFILTAGIIANEVALLVVSIITGIGILQKQRWAWFVGIGLNGLILSLELIALAFLPYRSANRFASIAISIASLYLLSRREVRFYLNALTRL